MLTSTPRRSRHEGPSLPPPPANDSISSCFVWVSWGVLARLPIRFPLDLDPFLFMPLPGTFRDCCGEDGPGEEQGGTRTFDACPLFAKSQRDLSSLYLLKFATPIPERTKLELLETTKLELLAPCIGLTIRNKIFDVHGSAYPTSHHLLVRGRNFLGRFEPPRCCARSLSLIA